MKAALATLLFAASTASAQVTLTPPQFTVSTASNDRVAARDTYVCLVPDIQNMASEDDQSVDPTTCTSGNDPSSSLCKEPYCTKSPYCKDSWWQTGRQMLLNYAYEMTGQWDKIDYDGINGNGTDPARSHWTGAKDHPRCDLIISLGDNADIDDGTRALNPTYGSLVHDYQRQWDTVSAFWDVINRSGVPYIFTQGNHDPMLPTQQLLTRLGTTGKSWFYQFEPSQSLSYAILAPTPTGKPFCVISMQWKDGIGTASGSDGQPTDTIITWAKNTVGCGGGYPTIIVQHASLGFSTVVGGTSLQSAPYAAIFMFVYGHYTPTPAGSTKGFGSINYSFFTFFSDWQEADRWGTDRSGQNGPFGNTPSDSGGSWYTIARVSPVTKIVEAWDWSPYWESRTPPNGVVQYTNSTINRAFDFDARFP